MGQKLHLPISLRLLVPYTSCILLHFFFVYVLRLLKPSFQLKELLDCTVLLPCFFALQTAVSQLSMNTMISSNCQLTQFEESKSFKFLLPSPWEVVYTIFKSCIAVKLCYLAKRGMVYSIWYIASAI